MENAPRLQPPFPVQMGNIRWIAHASPIPARLLMPLGNALLVFQLFTRWFRELASRKLAGKDLISTRRPETAKSSAPKANKKLDKAATSFQQTASASPPPSTAPSAQIPSNTPSLADFANSAQVPTPSSPASNAPTKTKSSAVPVAVSFRTPSAPQSTNRTATV